ncbi:hypothetical protein [Rhizobium rhizogenes]|uniref:hypothetical protein n=1 Tax=Rhizobium rhizogenes TaxID=359 RepID=UPI0022C67E09|nr:hypothetical protein [Rhizobium rhizogenes]MCZ7480548.1 hypothetical protein [Rhizobium rhizogenes]
MRTQELLKELSKAVSNREIDLAVIWDIALQLSSEASTDDQRRLALELKQASSGDAVRVKASAVQSAFASKYDERGFPIPGAFDRPKR